MSRPQETGVPPGKVRQIFVVEDHPVIRQSYAMLLDREPDLSIREAVGTAQQALAWLAHSQGALPDLVLVDVSLPDMDGINLVRQISIAYPDLPTLIISGHDDELYAQRALDAGARGYLNKTKLAEAMVGTIRLVLAAA